MTKLFTKLEIENLAYSVFIEHSLYSYTPKEKIPKISSYYSFLTEEERNEYKNFSNQELTDFTRTAIFKWMNNLFYSNQLAYHSNTFGPVSLPVEDLEKVEYGFPNYLYEAPLHCKLLKSDEFLTSLKELYHNLRFKHYGRTGFYCSVCNVKRLKHLIKIFEKEELKKLTLTKMQPLSEEYILKTLEGNNFNKAKIHHELIKLVSSYMNNKEHSAFTLYLYDKSQKITDDLLDTIGLRPERKYRKLSNNEISRYGRILSFLLCNLAFELYNGENHG